MHDSSDDKVSVREVGLRDGLQLVKQILPTETKLEWIHLQNACNFDQIEVTSFVPPAVVPQFADSTEVLAGANALEGLHAAVLVPNFKWATRALDNGATRIVFVLSASEEHNKANVRRTTDESIAEFKRFIQERNALGLQDQVIVSGAIATTFGCTIQGEVPESRVFDIAEQLLDAGANELNIADTVGYGNPVQVHRIFKEIISLAGDSPVGAHFHDTRAMGLANVVAALETGVRRFDASLGGLGGCPFSPGASGNIATEDTIYMLEDMGVQTGIDFDKLMLVRERLNGWLPDEPLEGRLLKAKPAKTFSPVL